MIQGHPPDGEATPARVLRTRRRPRTGQQARDRRRRLVTYALFIFSTVLMVNALVGENGYLATLRARHDQAALLASLARLRAENQDLQEQSRRLKDDPAAIEDAARRELGLIRPGETLVIIHNTRPAAPGAIPR